MLVRTDNSRTVVLNLILTMCHFLQVKNMMWHWAKCI